MPSPIAHSIVGGTCYFASRDSSKCRTDTLLEKKSLYGDTIGHIVMLPEESIKINSQFELWLAEKIILNQHSK